MSLGAIALIEKAMASASVPTFVEEITFPGDNSYPTGGTPNFSALLRAATGIKATRQLMYLVDCGAIAGHYCVYDAANDKLVVFVRTTGAEVANGVNLSGTTFRVCTVSW